MNSQNRIFNVSVEITKNELKTRIIPWILLIETNRYYEIKPEEGSVKRIYKERLNTIFDKSKYYSNGLLYCSAFCTEEHIENMHREVLKNLQNQINDYKKDLQINQKTIEQHLHTFIS